MADEQQTTGGETSSYSEGLSPAEQAYFDSRGEDTSAFETPPEAPPAPSSDEPALPLEGGEGEAPPKAANDDDKVDGEIELDENGQPRDKATGRFVPHSALHKERERRKATETELEQIRDRYTRAEERLNVLNDILQLSQQQGGPQPDQQAQPADELGPPPDPEEDIFGFVKWQAKKIELMERGQQEAQQRQQEQQQHQQYAQEVQTFYRNDAIQFLEKKPDFPDAYRHVANSYAAELRAQGVPEDRVNTVLMAEEARIAAQCRQEGRSPSEVIYQMALARGYSPAQATAASEQAPPEQQQQQPQPLAPRAQNQPNRIANIQRAQQATIPLSKAGGASAEGLTIETLADMSEDEFARVTSSLSKSQLRQLMGG